MGVSYRCWSSDAGNFRSAVVHPEEWDVTPAQIRYHPTMSTASRQIPFPYSRLLGSQRFPVSGRPSREKYLNPRLNAVLPPPLHEPYHDGSPSISSATTMAAHDLTSISTNRLPGLHPPSRDEPEKCSRSRSHLSGTRSSGAPALIASWETQRFLNLSSNAW